MKERFIKKKDQIQNKDKKVVANGRGKNSNLY